MKKLYIYILTILFTITGHSQLVGPIGPGTPTPTPINPIGPIGPIDPIGDGLVTYYKDADGDGWGNPNDKISYMPSIFNPNPPTGYVTRSGDCDDTNNQIYPRDWYLDFDKDGQGSDQELRGLTESDFILGGYPLPSVFSQTPKPLTTTISARVYKGCRPGGPYSYSMTKGDCNDNNSSIKIRTWYRDTDGDNFGTHTDTKQQCDQPEGYISQGFDCDDNDANKVPKYWYRDKDKDGWGKATYVINGQSITSDVKIQCDPPEGYVLRKGDCNDDDPSIIPQIWYLDHDKDGWGKIVDVSILELNNISGFDAKIACTKPIGLYVLKTGDCNDDNDQIHPETVWYQDADGDTWGDPNTTKIQCAQPTGFVSKAGDCEDGMPDIHPGAVWSYDPNTYSPPYISDQNFIYTRTPQKEITNVSEIQKRQDVMEEITYFDGFGRPIQQIGIAQAKDNTQHTFEDVIQHFSYSSIGRQDKDYLPYAEKGEQYNGRYRKGNIEGIVQHYYKNRYEGDFEGVARESVNAYSERQQERSPLARIEKQAAPGKDWAMGNGHEIKFEYTTNTINEVRAFTATVTTSGETTLSSPVPYYPIASLTKNITKDENWTSGTDHTTEEFTDKQGRVILKRTYNAAVAHDTYYVYDDFGNLSYVVPPKVVVDDGVSQTELDEMCEQFRYDYRNRKYAHKRPGREWEYTIYNKLDQVILRQDVNLRADNNWILTKYDALGRAAYTGIITDSRDRKVIQDEANTYTGNLWVERGNAVMIGGVTMYYNDGGYPKVNTGEVLTINYYDDYGFLASEDAVFNNPTTVYNEPVSDRTKSLPTGTKVKILGTSYWTTTATYYDKKARPIYVATQNEYLNSTDIVESKLDFVGKVEKTKMTHKKDSNAAIVTIDTFEYDHMGRPLKQTQSINGQQEVLTENSFDALGKPKSKILGSGLQTLDYKFHVRGWLKGINDVNNLGSDLFAYNLNYGRTTENVGASPLYNGNISEMVWKTASDNTKRAYGYKYNALNYLTDAKSSDGRYDVSNIIYDPNGNITSLTRHGWQNTSSYTNMDILNYEYNVGNKLLKVTDTGNKSYGFKDGSNTDNDYTYDDNGNQLTDRNKEITGITYNYLNLPTSYTFQNNPNKRINYVYDATGTQLKKTITDGAAVTVTEYNNGIEYKNGTLQMIMNPEGYAEPENDGSFTFVYQFKDYLKNVRLAYADSDKDGKVDIVRNLTDIDGDGDNHHEIRQVRDYYPYGLSWKYGSTHPNSLITGAKHNYGYNGKEYTEDLGLNLYEMDVRKYDPAIARWSSIDPIMHGTLSPYTAFDNNPVFWNDPSGASVIVKDGGDSITFTGQDAIDAFKAITGGSSESSDNEESNESESEGEGECCQGLKKFFTEVLNKAYGKSTKDFDFHSDNYWVGDDGYTYYVKGDNEFYKIYWNRYEQVDELPPMMDYMEIMSPAGVGKKGIAMMGSKAGKTSIVYWSIRGGKIIYVGITNNFARRGLQHAKKKGIDIEKINDSLTNLSRDDARAVEQVLIEFFGLGGKKGQTGQLLNRINSIAEKNKKYAESIKRGKELLEAAGLSF